jgi:hypothetical protein
MESLSGDGNMKDGLKSFESPCCIPLDAAGVAAVAEKMEEIEDRDEYHLVTFNCTTAAVEVA